MKRYSALGALFLGLTLPALGCGGGGPASPSGPAPTPAPDATVGPAGGTVSVAGGAVRLVVPAGALSTAVGLTLRAATQVPLDPHAVGGAAYVIGPAGTTFAVPATLSIGFDAARAPSGVETVDLRVHLLAGDTWQALAGAAEPSAGQASAAVSGAGTYGVRWLGPREPCAGARDADFDFWLGSWNFRQNNGGTGTNDITREGGGCLTEEHFQDAAGGRGRSVSLFSRGDGKWHQTYIDSAGGRIVLVGSLDGGRMVMNTTPSERTTWDPLDANTIRYFTESTSDGGRTWRLTFDSRYTRR